MNNNAIVLKSAEPLQNEMLKIRKLYYVCFAAMVIGLIFSPLFGIGILGLLVVYCIHSIVLSSRMDTLRATRFQYGTLTVEEIVK